jgi:siroheme synthase-like protein
VAFDYPVTLNLEGKLCLVAGSGPLACERMTGLLRARANVFIVTPNPSRALAAQAGAFNVPLVLRPVTTGDLEGCELAIVTREDTHDIPALHAAAQKHGVMFAALDDIAHCDFGAVSQIRRGSLTVTVSSGGRAPALAKRLRQRLEAELPTELTELVEVIARARRNHGPREVEFDEWSARWSRALEDLDALVAMLHRGDAAEVEAHILAALRNDDH